MKEIDVKGLRESLDLTQEELARKLDIGVRAVARWEAGENYPSRLMKKKLLRLQKKGEKNGN